MTDQSTTPAPAETAPADRPERGDAANALESALTDISGLADVLMQLGQGDSDGCYAYLGGQLDDHYKAAHDAFRRIFKLNGAA